MQPVKISKQKPAGIRQIRINPKKKSQVSAEESTGWAVSYSDMLMVLMSFFVIFFSFEDQEKKETGVRKEKAMQMLSMMLNVGGSGEELVKKIESSYQQDIDQNKARDALAGPLAQQGAAVLSSQTSRDSTDVGVRSLEIVLPQETLFGLGQGEVGSAAQFKVKKLAKQIVTIEGLRRIEIIGHTDSSIPNNVSQWKNNFSLSSVRAGSIANIFLDEKIPENLILIRGMGATEPLLVDRDKEGKLIAANAAKNRRVQIIIQWTGNPLEEKKDEP